MTLLRINIKNILDYTRSNLKHFRAVYKVRPNIKKAGKLISVATKIYLLFIIFRFIK